MNKLLSTLNNTFLMLLMVLLALAGIIVISRPLIDDLRCKYIIKKHSKTFYKAFSQLESKTKKNAIYAVYTFCRMADDYVDEDHDIKKLIRLETQLSKYVTFKQTSNFMWRSLKRHTKTYYDKFDFKPFFEMIEGQKMDLNFKGYETVEDLLGYCYHVASTVGLMLTPILAYEKQESLKDFSISLGYAMQITNILRDIGQDAKNGRIYLPKKLMNEANYTYSSLSSGKINDEFIYLFETLAKLAETNFDHALKDTILFPKDARIPLSLAILLYKEIINVVRENGYDVFNKRAIVSEVRKKEIINNYIKTL